MTNPASLLSTVTQEAVETIASDVFEAMIDGEPGHLMPWLGPAPEFDEPRYTWVDVRGETVTRVLLTTGRETGERITRALLALPADAAVDDADLVDAAGELANVVGGNVKSLVVDGGALTLPIVAHQEPTVTGATVILDATVSWRNTPVRVSLWTLP